MFNKIKLLNKDKCVFITDKLSSILWPKLRFEIGDRLSNHAVGGLLLQKNNDDTLEPIWYINRALTAIKLK